ncbi:MAG: hypothetical protein GY906_10870 [bacterium]|nr:hypothetical protein [bacterium]
MTSIRVLVEYDQGTGRQKFLLPADKPVKRLMRAIVTKLGLPWEHEDGRRLEYQLRCRETGKILPRGKTLSEAGVSDGTVLEVVAGTEKAVRRKSSKTPTTNIKQASTENKQARKTEKILQKPPPLEPTLSDSRIADARQAIAKAQAALPLRCGKDNTHIEWEDHIVSCPICGALYHEQCWSANGKRCTKSQCTGSGSQKSQMLWETVSDISDTLEDLIVELPEDVALENEEFFDMLCEVDSNISDVFESYEDAEFQELMQELEEPCDELDAPTEQVPVQSIPPLLKRPGSPVSLIPPPSQQFPDDSDRWEWIFEVGLFLIYAIVGGVLGFVAARLTDVGCVGVLAGLGVATIVWFVRERL